MDDLSRFCCLNPACGDLGPGGHGNLTVTARYGPGNNRRMLRGRTCRPRFSERKGTPLFDARLPAEAVTAVLAHVADGVGTRKTGHLTGVHTAAVTRYTRLAGEHAEAVHDEVVAVSPRTREVEFDEKWSFVTRKEKDGRPEDPRRGDCWDHVAFDPETRLVVRRVVGERTADATRALVRDFRRRTGGRAMRLVASGEYPAYAEAIREAYGVRVVPPRTGRPGHPPRKPHTAAAPEVTYATVRKEKETNRVVRVSTRVVFGTTAAVTRAAAASSVGW